MKPLSIIVTVVNNNSFLITSKRPKVIQEDCHKYVSGGNNASELETSASRKTTKHRRLETIERAEMNVQSFIEGQEV